MFQREIVAKASAGDGALLIYAPVPLFRGIDGALMVEAQAGSGLRLWAEQFGRLIVMMPLARGPAPVGWVSLASLGDALARIEVVTLPEAYRPDQFLRALPAARRRVRALIERADYLSFAIGGLFGDWGAVACFEAARMRRPYAVWTDRVESAVTRRAAATAGPWKPRLRARLTHRPMAWLERAAIRRATLGLFHGRETYDAYATHCRLPAIVHDIHVARADHIAAPALAAKMAAAADGPLRICYAGRADAMKGPLDWVDVLERLAAARVDFVAEWLGDGAELPAMRRRLSKAGLSGRVALPGFVDDRARVLRALREAQVFLFCHKTPESPRCLIEALISGCPIVGYSGAFAADLIAGHGGGALVPRDDVGALTEAVAALARDRRGLADLIGRAARDGEPFEDRAVFEHRAALIREHLGR